MIIRDLPTVILDIDDTVVNSREVDFFIFNRATGKNLRQSDFPTVFSMLKIFGVTREEAHEIRAGAEKQKIKANLIPGFAPAIRALDGLVRFDMATAREDFAREYTERLIAELMPPDTRTFFSACPKEDCDSPACQVRLKKLDIAREVGALVIYDDHPGEFTRHCEPPSDVGLVCCRHTYNADIPPYFPRHFWSGFVTHVRQLVAAL